MFRERPGGERRPSRRLGSGKKNYLPPTVRIATQFLQYLAHLVFPDVQILGQTRLH
jgi:hypothetical protein